MYEKSGEDYFWHSRGLEVKKKFFNIRDLMELVSSSKWNYVVDIRLRKWGGTRTNIE